MNYSETLHWMFNKLPMYQRQGKAAYNAKLEGIQKLSTHLKNPQSKFKTVHVAGTNGKGSTSHMIASILQEAGYKTGLYTSPHLKDFRERIKINGEPITEEDVIHFIDHHKDYLEENSFSFFEMTVGMAFDYFANEEVDIAVIEVGLGGRLDSTNIITPEVSVITNIGWDHMDFLGDTLEKIAFEKGGIIKQNIPVVIGEYQEDIFPVFEKIASQKAATLCIAEKEIDQVFDLDLKGKYQEKNAKTAVAATRKLDDFNISEKDIVKGLLQVVKNTNLMGRWQQIGTSPKIICDTAHNKEGLTLVFKQLAEERYNQLHIVLGMVNDKKTESILALFPQDAHYYFCQPNIPRGLDAKILVQNAKSFKLKGEIYLSVSDALEAAKENARKDDFIYVGGSTFVVAEIL